MSCLVSNLSLRFVLMGSRRVRLLPSNFTRTVSVVCCLSILMNLPRLMPVSSRPGTRALRICLARLAFMPYHRFCFLVIDTRDDILAVLVNVLRSSQLGASHFFGTLKDDAETSALDLL